MRRLVAIALCVLAAGLAVALPATGADDGPYEVRAIFDNGGFIVEGEEVRIAGARVGTVESVDVSREGEIVSREGGDQAIPGKAVVVLAIENDAFKDFREDASCIIKPQSLIGEKFVDCTPTNPRAPGTPPPPELATIPDGEPGAGQRLLPLENNGKAVDLDLVNNIYRAPYRDRFRLILNDLGAGFAARGDDLGAIIDRANPALRQTDAVLKILADQNQALASLASDGDAVLAPLAREREHVGGFINNAAVAGQATAERSDDLEAGLQRFPGFLRELRATMRDLRYFSDQGAPLFEDLEVAAPHLSKATQKLGPFASAGIPAFQSLGTAAQSSGPKLVASNPLLGDLAQFANGAVPVGRDLSSLLDSLSRTNGFSNLFDFIYYTVANTNAFDQFGHFLRGNVQVTSCLNVQTVVNEGCDANFIIEDEPKKKKKKKKKKKGKKSTGGFSAPLIPSPSPEPQSPQPPASVDELIPELQPGDPPAEDPGAAPQAPAPEAGPSSDTQQSAAFNAAPVPGENELSPMSLDEAGVLLDYLLGASR